MTAERAPWMGAFDRELRRRAAELADLETALSLRDVRVTHEGCRLSIRLDRPEHGDTARAYVVIRVREWSGRRFYAWGPGRVCWYPVGDAERAAGRVVEHLRAMPPHPPEPYLPSA